MTENMTSKVLGIISAVLSVLFILRTADVIICQKKYAELWNVPSNEIETAGMVIPFSAIAYLILAAALIVICVRIILKKYSAADRIIAAVLWGVMFFAAFAAYSVQLHYTMKNGGIGTATLITLHDILNLLSALLVLSAVITIAAADCAVFKFNRQPADSRLSKAAISFLAVYIFATLAVMFFAGEKPTVIYSVIVCWVFAVTAMILSAIVMSKRGGAVPLIVCLVLFAATLAVRPFINSVQSKFTSFNGLEALADFSEVSAYCRSLDILLYAGTALSACGAARNIYAKEKQITDTDSEISQI